MTKPAESAPRRYDTPLLVAAVLLLAYGVVMVWSASAFVAAEETENPYHFVVRQLIAIGVGLPLALGATLLPYRQLDRYATHLYIFSLVLLPAVWLPGLGHSANGATRWFGVAGFNFQPAELAKFAVLVALAAFLQKRRGELHDWKNVLIPAVLMVAAPLCFIIAQPDFGSTAIIALLCGVMVFFAGLRLRWMVTGGTVLASLLGLVMVLEPYRRERLISFLDPFANCAGSGYQVCESLLALHHGGLWGQGLGDGVAKLLYLPEPYNDFIAAVLGEELGIIGFAVLTGLYAFVAWRGMEIARNARDMFGSLLASTFTVMIVGQACLNLGVVLGVVPPKGLVLPFVSYGASAMMVNMAAIGVLLSISAEARQDEPLAAPSGLARA
ncbi:MAG: putative lipid II flippase FtsW [Deltaproteobacteria bacterium]|nr:putative lipid II flippase FtsW [Deltaproteobacteria bacterium]